MSNIATKDRMKATTVLTVSTAIIMTCLTVLLLFLHKPPLLQDNAKINKNITAYFTQHNKYKPESIQVYKFHVSPRAKLPIVDAKVLVYSTNGYKDLFKLTDESELPPVIMGIFRGNIIKMHIDKLMMLSTNDITHEVINETHLPKAYVLIIPILGKSKILGFYNLIYEENVEMTTDFIKFTDDLAEKIREVI